LQLIKLCCLFGVMLNCLGCAFWTGEAFDSRDVVSVNRAVEAVSRDTTRPANLHPAVMTYEAVTLATENIAPPSEYRVGPGDVMFISVNGLPEFGSSPVTTSESRVLGTRVDGTGSIQLPYLGATHVSKMTLREIQAKLKKDFQKFLVDPWVVVEMVEHRSKPIYLVGQFRQSRAYYMDRPINLVQGLSLGGGVTDKADLRNARIQRNGKVLPVDIYRLLNEGDLSQNIWLHAEDTIYVPDNVEQRVFVLGSVPQPGPIAMVHGKMTLVQALTDAGGAERTGSAIRYVRIIRSISATRGELLVLNYERILRGEALDFPLVQGDIVYVPRSGLGSWNDTLKQILPTMQAVSSALTPFALIASQGSN